MTIIIEATPKNPALTTKVGSAEGLRIFTNPQLLAIHNEALGKTTSKFASRAKAVAQTWDAIREFAAVDLRATPPVLIREGEALPGDLSAPVAPGSAPDEPIPTKSSAEIAQAVLPGSVAVGMPAAKPVGRPKKKPAPPAAKQPDGTYRFNMDPRKPRSLVCGGRRPELIAMLRKRPTFPQLMQRYKPHGETEEKRAFNLATAITCMCHVCGYGVRTGAGGRIDLLEPLA